MSTEGFMMEAQINKYLIVLKNCDDFIINIKQDVNRPNNPDDSELIERYMNNNYLGERYDVVDLEYIDYYPIVEI